MTNYEIMCSSIDKAAKHLEDNLIFTCPPGKEISMCNEEACTKCWRRWLGHEVKEDV